MPIFFAEKMRSFCSAKASHIFSTKNISVFGYKVVLCFQQPGGGWGGSSMLNRKNFSCKGGPLFRKVSLSGRVKVKKLSSH